MFTMFYIQSRDSFFKFKQFKWVLKYVGFEVSQRAHYWIWGRPKGHVRGPKGHSPFGKCLARTLLVCPSSLYLTSLHMMRLLPPPTPLKHQSPQFLPTIKQGKNWVWFITCMMLFVKLIQVAHSFSVHVWLQWQFSTVAFSQCIRQGTWWAEW